FIKEFNNHLSTAFKLGETLSLPLTGGMDSRAVLSGSLKYKDKLHCYTHGLSNSEDVKISKKIIKLLNINYTHYNELGQSFIENIPETATELANVFEGMLNSVLFAHLKFSYERESKISDTFLTGIGGEL